MAITTTTYLNFRGDARAALGFYQSVFGGHLSVVAYGDFSMPKDLPDADKVVLGQVKADNDAATASQRWLSVDTSFQYPRGPRGRELGPLPGEGWAV
ncbi:hypothetical protein [Actinoplanes sp. NBRC 103695]|uniref:hypothetical protein n=1 Tax=Actinoplanes sp. NBRC 103695 TaxID=3032202 RepID=UPI0024A043EA|nr:hypothetical protein [Actinoplanes sp. NBRC 103695]GLY97256.1 hypothetical protein Acsp02_45100 [Actinoplanes sp. NBRC 103695]